MCPRPARTPPLSSAPTSQKGAEEKIYASFDATAEPRRRDDALPDHTSAIETLLDEESAAARPAQAAIWPHWTTHGQPLATGVRESMGARFGHDFGHVRVHTGLDGSGGPSVRAYATGSDIWFRGANEAADPGLLAHELAHVVQQARGDADSLRMAGGDVDQRRTLERQARDFTTGTGIRRRFPQEATTRGRYPISQPIQEPADRFLPHHHPLVPFIRVAARRSGLAADRFCDPPGCPGRAASRMA